MDSKKANWKSFSSCPRCEGNHKRLRVRQFAKPMLIFDPVGKGMHRAVFLEWAMCPVTKEPIVIHAIKWFSISECEACGKPHERLPAYPIIRGNKIVLNWRYGFCPTTGQPIHGEDKDVELTEFKLAK